MRGEHPDVDPRLLAEILSGLRNNNGVARSIGER
jgi:hypothetical protein